jgi:hypothetical protein
MPITHPAHCCLMLPASWLRARRGVDRLRLNVPGSTTGLVRSRRAPPCVARDGP